MRNGMNRTDRRKYCNRETDTGTRGSMNCHLRRLRMSGGDPIANIKLLEDLAVIMKDGRIFKNTLSKQRDAQEPSSIPKRKR
jgi:hypothetical protein